MLTSRQRFLVRRLGALAVLAAGGLLAIAITGRGPAETATSTSPTRPVVSASGGRRPSAEAVAAAARQRRTGEARRRVHAHLRAGVASAARLGGRVDAAVMLDGWEQPAVARAGSNGSGGGEIRMWSLSKVVTAVTVLRAMGWGDRPGRAANAELREALSGAFTRSENCRQRRVVLALQELLGSTDEAADGIAHTFSVAGVRPLVARTTQQADATCREYLGQLTGLRSPRAKALTLGTSRWHVAQAARFAHTLGRGGYGQAITRLLLDLMRQPKKLSREATPGNYTADLAWGAGRVLTCLRPAYKAGWGGARAKRFVAEQLAIVRAGNRTATIAVSFQPSRQPDSDDPGLTAAPDAIETVMRSVAVDLGAPSRGCTRSQATAGA